MGTSRKRGRQEMEASQPPAEQSMIERIRNMWEFANLAQWIFIFGKAVKIDENLDIEELEMECLKMHSTVLSDIGLALLKFVSSHRGLTPEIFDDFTRRQYLAKSPLRNPFGTDEEPKKFLDFDIFAKIRVLQQLTQWTMINPDRIRERMEEQKDSDQTYWRIEPFGWDSYDRTYFVLDDNRLYRQSPLPPPRLPTPPPKKNSKKAKAALRASKRRKISEPAASSDEGTQEPSVKEEGITQDDGLGGMEWECVAITLDDLNNFIASIGKSRDPNEKLLRSRLMEDVLPLLEKQEEARKRKVAQKERELLNLEKLAMAKRSSRIAGKLEQQRQEEEAREIAQKKHAEVVSAKKEQEKWIKLERERESRMMTREQRLKEREARRIQHEEELAHLSEDNKKLESGESRLSERHLKAEIEKKKQALEELAEEDGWVFDCICGAYGQVDDGTHSIACEKCNVWQHTKCVGISEAEASRDDFHFVCKTCKRRAEEEEKAKHRPTIKLKVNRPALSSSPGPAPSLTSSQPNGIALKDPRQIANGSPSAFFLSQKPASIHFASPSRPTYESPYAQAQAMLAKPHSHGSNGSNTDYTILPKTEERLSSHISVTKQSPQINGYNSPRPNFQFGQRPSSEHAFSPPQPYSPTSLPPPSQPQSYSFVNGRSSPSAPGSLDSPAPSQQSTYNKAQPYRHPSPQATPTSSYTGYQFSPSQPTKVVQNGQSYSEAFGIQSIQSSQSQPTQNYSAIAQGRLRDSEIIPSPLANKHVLRQLPSPIGENPLGSDVLQRHSTAEKTSSVIPSPIPLNSASPGQQQEPHGSIDIGQVVNLQTTMTGISPTKHSPPRPTTANGVKNIGPTAPSILPPIASLAPMPQQPNLSPPVKMAEPEKNRQTPQMADQ